MRVLRLINESLIIMFPNFRSISIFLLVIFVFLILFYYNWKRRHLYLASMKYQGPKTLPIIGNGLSFLCHSDEILNRIRGIIRKYGDSPLRFWLGPKLVLAFTDPSLVEKILTSSKLAYKSDLYDFMKPIGGEGLITATGGPLYRSHRKVIQPMVNLKWCESTLVIFQKHIDKCMKNLDTFADKGTFNILKVIEYCFADMISETILGFDMNAQNGENLEYVRAYKVIYDVFYMRIVKPWYHSDFIFNLSKHKKEEKRCSFLARDLIEKAKIQRITKKNTGISTDFTPLIDEIQRHRDENPTVMNEEDFVSHLATLYAASEDTLMAVTSMLCVCFGMYPKYQNLAAEEVLNSFDPENPTMENLQKLPYLDMCIKDALRLSPIAAFIARDVIEDTFVTEKWPVPKGATLLIPIVDLHIDKTQWENPRHFYPDHFLPENVAKRHPFSYLPFSAGPRNCIGKIVANAGMKLMMANILRHFEIEADGTFPDLRLKADISVRLRDGYNVRITRRQQKLTKQYEKND